MPLKQRAIVIGGSMAGLLAARALADYFQEVTVLERDNLPATAALRRGVPQGGHAHGILASGRRVLDAFFPGISTQLIERGARSGDIGRDARWFLEGASLSRCASGLDALLVSRPLLELAVRNRVRELRNVRLVENCAVDELVSTPDNRRVSGVKAGGEFLRADLVIDAEAEGLAARSGWKSSDTMRPWRIASRSGSATPRAGFAASLSILTATWLQSFRRHPIANAAA